MWRYFTYIIVCALLYSPLLNVRAQSTPATTVSTPPMGFVRIDIVGRSDNWISIPVLQPTAATGKVITGTANTVSVEGVAWVASQWAPPEMEDLSPHATFYLEFATGHLQGLTYKITGNSADTIVLDVGSDSLLSHRLGALAAGDLVRIRPYWTVGTAFSPTGASSLTPFAELPAEAQADGGDSLLLFDEETLKVNGLFGGALSNKTPSRRLVRVENTLTSSIPFWRSPGDTTSNRHGTILPPLSPVLVRRKNPAPLQFWLLGDAWQTRTVTYLAAGEANTPGNDNFVAIARSEPVALKDLQLIDSNAPSQSLFKGNLPGEGREDLILAFDVAPKGFERPPAYTYFYTLGQGWRELSSSELAGETLLDPARVYILRKRPASSSGDWTQNGIQP